MGRLAGARPVHGRGGVKCCKLCKASKPLDQFNRARSTLDGRRGECKACSAKRSRLWRETYPEKWAAHHRRRQYRVSPSMYKAMLLVQGGVCAICRCPEMKRASLSVDHDHACCSTVDKKSCGKCVRGLICARCNRGLGAFLDSRAFLAAALSYLDPRTVRKRVASYKRAVKPVGLWDDD
jgi:hypothetical protein